MRKTTTASRGLTWAFAAVLAVTTTPTIYAAGDGAAARGKLNSELPAGVTLARASYDQTAGAIKQAVAKDPSMATSILGTAIRVKTPKEHELSCEVVMKFTRAAVASDQAEASKLVDLASSMRPGCSDALVALLTTTGDPENNDTPGLFNTADEYAFGAGFGPGFPGSPGFVGSPPSGSVALPAPSATPMTTVTPG